MKTTDVSLIVAPFGFGPTSKAIAIAKEFIKRGYSVKLLGDKNTLRFADDAGILAYEYEYRSTLILSELHSRLVISYLDISTKIIRSEGVKLYFADSLFWVRGRFERSYDYPADVVFSQKFFADPLESEIERTKEFHEVEAILKPGFSVDLPPKKQQLIFYPGGLRSPYLGDRYGRMYFEWCTKVLLEASEKVNWPKSQMIFVLPPQLDDGKILNNLKKNGIQYRINCSDISGILMESTHAFISPGIETTLESLASGISPLFTPAFNGNHIPQLLADRKSGVGFELSGTFNDGLKRFECGADNLSGLSKEVEEYVIENIQNEKVYNEAVESTVKYLKSSHKVKDRYPFGRHGAKQIVDYSEEFLKLESIKNAYYRVSAKARIRCGNKVLLIEEDSKDWDLPGGGVEHGETIEDALHRELLEEIGISNFTISGQPRFFKMIDASENRPLLFIVYDVKIDEKALKKNLNEKIKFFEENNINEKIVDYSLEYENFINGKEPID